MARDECKLSPRAIEPLPPPVKMKQRSPLLIQKVRSRLPFPLQTQYQIGKRGKK